MKNGGAKFVPANNLEGRRLVATESQIEEARDEMYIEKANNLMTKERKIDSHIREKKLTKDKSFFNKSYFFDSIEEFNRIVEDDKYYVLRMSYKKDGSSDYIYEMTGPYTEDSYEVKDSISRNSAKHFARSGKELKNSHMAWKKIDFRSV